MTTDDQLALQRAFVHATAYLRQLDTASAATTTSLDELRRTLARALPQHGVPAVQVIDELVADTAGGILGSQGGRFFGWVIGGGLPAAMAADWLTSVWDQNTGIHACAPAAAVTEEIAGAWLRELFELPPESSFAFTTGAQMAHVTCLAAARHALLAARGWDVERDGLAAAPRIRILANADRHGSVDRALRLLGFGTASIENLAADASGSVAVQTLRQALAASGDATIVLLQAGELNRATFDSFAELAPVARKAGAWTHVDGAFGLWARVSPQHRHLVQGVELCDSWTTDGHKYLNVPYDSGFAFVRDAAAHRAAMTLATSYLPAGGSARDPLDFNPEFSRRARAFPVYAALRELGRDGLAALIARTCRHAAELVNGIGQLPGAEIVARPILNQGLVRFVSPSNSASTADHDRRTNDVIAAINVSGEAFFGGVTWRGQRAMRISVCNWRTCDADVSRAIAAARQALLTTKHSDSGE